MSTSVTLALLQHIMAFFPSALLVILRIYRVLQLCLVHNASILRLVLLHNELTPVPIFLLVCELLPSRSLASLQSLTSPPLVDSVYQSVAYTKWILLDDCSKEDPTPVTKFDESAWTTDVTLNSIIIRGRKKATNNGTMSFFTKSTFI